MPFSCSTSSPCSLILFLSAAQLEIVCVALMHLSAQASSVNGSFPSLSSETQRILDRMDDSGAFKNVKFTETDSPSPSGDEPDVSYVELHFKTLSVPRVRTNGDSLTSTYSELKFRKDEPLIDEGLAPPIASGPGELLITAQTDSQHNFRKVEPLINEDEDPPISPGPGGMPTAAQTAAQEKERKVKIGNRPYRVICLLCLVTSALIVTVVGLSIHVSQIRQSKVTSDRNYHELNSTLQSELSALNSNLSDLKRRHSDLRHQFTEMETKFRSVNETKDRICELLNSSREQTCSENWIRNKDRCYFISAIDESYDAAKQHCSRFDSRLLEINSNDEANFVYNSVHHGYRTYWIGKCEDRNVESNLLYTVKDRKPTCTLCKLYEWNYKCGDEHYFICEKSAPLFSDVLEKMLDLCQEPMSPT